MKRRLCILLILMGSSLLFSGTQKVVEKTYADFSDGKNNGWILGQFGTLQTGIPINHEKELSSTIVFQMLTEPKGSLLIATGNDGKVYRVHPEDLVSGVGLNPDTAESTSAEPEQNQEDHLAKEEKPSTEKSKEQVDTEVEQDLEIVFDAKELMVHCIALDPQGNIFAGTSPDGKVYKITPEGKIELFFDPKETYIWDLEITPDGDLLVACGGRGALYRLSPNYLPHQEIKPIYESADRNISSIVIRQNKNYLLGLNPSGQILEIDTEGTVLRTAFTEMKEITQIVETSERKIFFSTFDKENTNHQNLKPGLWEWQEDGYLRPIWQSPSKGIISFARNGKDFVIGAADQTDLFSLSEGSPWEHWGSLEKGSFVSKILPVKGGDGEYWVATSSPAYLYKIGSKGSGGKLTYSSGIIDVKRWSQWGHLRIDGNPNANLSVKTRSGSFPDTNKNWEDWQPLENGKVTSRSNRFLQYQLEIDPREKSRIDAVTLFYRFPNQAPVFFNLKVVALGMDIQKIPNPSKHYLDLKKFFGGSPVVDLLGKNQKLKSRPVLKDETGKITVGWIAKDPEGDSLEYDLEIRNLSDGSWVSLVKNIEESIYSFDASGFPSGHYQIRVTASDHSNHPQGEDQQATMLSESFLIDFKSPEIILLQDSVSDDSVSFIFQAKDAQSVIKGAYYILNGKEKQAVSSKDQIFDQQSETFDLSWDSLPVGKHSLLFFVSDTQRNQAMYTMNFEVK